jgi:hypothetical protein
VAESQAARDQFVTPPADLATPGASAPPLFCQYLRRRHQVMPILQPIPWGSISQGIPVISTNIPVSTLRSGSGGLPFSAWARETEEEAGSLCATHRRESPWLLCLSPSLGSQESIPGKVLSGALRAQSPAYAREGRTGSRSRSSEREECPPAEVKSSSSNFGKRTCSSRWTCSMMTSIIPSPMAITC